jgi:acetyl-CoA acetyltransferase
MSYGPVVMPASARELSCKAAIVGIGETDFGADYRAARENRAGYSPPSVEELLNRAFRRALADSGLSHDDIDGIAVSCSYGGPTPADVAKQFGVKARYAVYNGNLMAGPLPRVCADVAAGKADVVAMLFVIAPRSGGRQFGGTTFPAGSSGPPSSYYYYHPWGWSSQAAHWALIFSHYMHAYGVNEADLAAVSIQLRRHAANNPNAVMQNQFSLEEYLASRYIVRPLHLLDICLVNDGAVCLIVSKSELARSLSKSPVLVAGWGEAKVKSNKMQAMVRDRLRPIIQDAGAQAFAMAGVSLADIGHFEGYDPSSIHLINQVEGHEFCKPGQGLAFCRDGGMGLSGRIPTNTEGGNLSGAYMQGWSQVVETVRQMRGEAGARQVADLDVALSTLSQTDQAHSIIYQRGD